VDNIIIYIIIAEAALITATLSSDVVFGRCSTYSGQENMPHVDRTNSKMEVSLMIQKNSCPRTVCLRCMCALIQAEMIGTAS